MKRGYFCGFFWQGIIYMGMVMFLAFTRLVERSFIKESFCRLDCCVYMMRPLMYSVIMVVPLILNTFSAFRNELTYMFVMRRGSWKYMLHWQIKKSMIYAVVYAGCFMGLIYIISYRFPAFDWNVAGSYYSVQTNSTISLYPLETIFYVFLLCVIRNFILQNILLFFMWKNEFMKGIVFLCIISCFEIAQMRIRVFYWLISPDYSAWISRKYRIMMLVGIVIYLFGGYQLFDRMMNKKELSGHGKA